MSKLSILSLAIRLINILELIHSAGYIYNDLKLGNILVGYKDEILPFDEDHDCFENCTISLIHFGFASRYYEKKTKKLKE